MARPLAVKVKRGLTDGMAAQKRGPPNEVLIDGCGTSRGVWGNGSWFRVHGSGLDGKAAPTSRPDTHGVVQDSWFLVRGS